MKISTITIVFNARETIKECLDSILSQTYPDVEMIVIDGNSTDGTKLILDDYRSLLSVYISETDKGVYDAMNKGIKNATGEIIGFLHADDLYANQDVLALVAKSFVDKKIDAVYGDLTCVSNDENKNIIRYWRAGDLVRNKFRFGWMPPHPTFFVRRRVYNDFGSYDTSLCISADYECMIRFLWVDKIPCDYIAHMLVKMRVGGISNRSIKNIIIKSFEDYKVIKAHRLGGVITLISKNLRKITQFLC